MANKREFTQEEHDLVGEHADLLLSNPESPRIAEIEAKLATLPFYSGTPLFEQTTKEEKEALRDDILDLLGGL